VKAVGPTPLHHCTSEVVLMGQGFLEALQASRAGTTDAAEALVCWGALSCLWGWRELE
jgi:hypothetical protein